MWTWIKDRMKEPSSAAGLGLLATGLSLLAGAPDDQAGAVGQSVGQAVGAVGGENWMALATAMTGGALAIFAPERGRR